MAGMRLSGNVSCSPTLSYSTVVLLDLPFIIWV